MSKKTGSSVVGFLSGPDVREARTDESDPNVWTGGVLQEENLETGGVGLAPMYPAYLWSVKDAPGHHGYERAFDLISRKASNSGC